MIRWAETLSAHVKLTSCANTYLCNRMAFHVRIQLLEQTGRVLGAEATKMLILQEEVHTQVCLGDDRGVLNGELPDARQDEVLQSLDTNNARPVVDEENVRVLKGKLTRSSPQSELSVVPALVRSCL